MADNFDALQLHLTLDTSDYSKELKSTSSTSKKVLGELSAQADSFAARWQDVTHNIRSAKSVLSSMALYGFFEGLTSVIYSSAAAITQFSMNMETAEISMQYFVDGTDKAAKSLEYLREMQALAADTSFTTESAVNLSKFMSAMGLNISVTKDVMRVINDAAAATGASEANMQRIVTSIGQILTKGRLAAEEVRQLANANIPIYEILQEEMGLTGDQIKNIGNYWYDAEESVVAILTGLQKRYEGAAEKVADTMSGMVNSIQDNALMIGSIAASGVYDDAADKILVIRDALSEYRDIAVNMGSTALLREVLLDIDPSGDVGNKVFTLVGGFRQLIGTAGDLYITCQPLVTMFGKGLYYSITTLTVGVNALGETLEATDNVLNSFGISLEDVFEIMAGVYITYKVAKTFGYVGQAAAALTMNLYNTGKAAWSLLPASITANTGLGLLTGGLLAAGGIALYFSGALDKVFDSLAGLSSSETGLPSDFEAAFAEYEAAMELYNQQIAQYEGMFDQSFSTIADNGSAAFRVVQEQAKKSAAKASDSWLASFDEVYKVPEDNEAGNTELSFPDLSALIDKLKFIFPAKIESELKIPEFDWGKVFNQDNEEATKAALDAWTPVMLLGVSSAFAHAFRKRFAEEAKKASTGPAPKKTVTPEEKAAEKMAAAADAAKTAEENLAEVTKKMTAAADALADNATAKNLAELNAYISDYKLAEKQLNSLRAAAGLEALPASDILTKAEARSLTGKLDVIAQQYLQQAAHYKEVLKAGQTTTPDLLELNRLDAIKKQLQKLVENNPTVALSETVQKALKQAYGPSTDDLIKSIKEDIAVFSNAIIKNSAIEDEAYQAAQHLHTTLKELQQQAKKLGKSLDTYADVMQQAQYISNTYKSVETAKKAESKYNEARLAGIDGAELEDFRTELVNATKQVRQATNSFIHLPTVRTSALMQQVDSIVNGLDARLAHYTANVIERVRKAEAFAALSIQDTLQDADRVDIIRGIGKQILGNTEDAKVSQLDNLFEAVDDAIKRITIAVANIDKTVAASSYDEFFKLFKDDLRTQYQALGISESTANVLASTLVDTLSKKTGTYTHTSLGPSFYDNLPRLLKEAIPEVIEKTLFDAADVPGDTSVLRNILSEIEAIGEALRDYDGVLPDNAIERLTTALLDGISLDVAAYSDDLKEAIAHIERARTKEIVAAMSSGNTVTAQKALNETIASFTNSLRIVDTRGVDAYIPQTTFAKQNTAKTLTEIGIDDPDKVTLRIVDAYEQLIAADLEAVKAGLDTTIEKLSLLTEVYLNGGGSDAPEYIESIITRLEAFSNDFRRILIDSGAPIEVLSDLASDTYEEITSAALRAFEQEAPKVGSAGELYDLLHEYMHLRVTAARFNPEETLDIIRQDILTQFDKYAEKLSAAPTTSLYLDKKVSVEDARAILAGAFDDINIPVYNKLSADDVNVRDANIKRVEKALQDILANDMEDVALSSAQRHTLIEVTTQLDALLEKVDKHVAAGFDSARAYFLDLAKDVYEGITDNRVKFDVAELIRKMSDEKFDISGKRISDATIRARSVMSENTRAYFANIQNRIFAQNGKRHLSNLSADTFTTIDMAAVKRPQHYINDDTLKQLFRQSGMLMSAGSISALENGVARVGTTVVDVYLRAINDNIRKIAELQGSSKTAQQLVRQQLGEILEKISLSNMAGTAGHTYYNLGTGTVAQVDALASIPTPKRPLHGNVSRTDDILQQAWSSQTIPVEIKTTTRHGAFSGFRSYVVENAAALSALDELPDRDFINDITDKLFRDAYMLSVEQTDTLLKNFDIDAYLQAAGIGVTTNSEYVALRWTEIPEEYAQVLLAKGLESISLSGMPVSVDGQDNKELIARLDARLKSVIAGDNGVIDGLAFGRAFTDAIKQSTFTVIVPITDEMKQTALKAAAQYRIGIEALKDVYTMHGPQGLVDALTGVTNNDIILPGNARLRHIDGIQELLKTPKLSGTGSAFSDLYKRIRDAVSLITKAGASPVETADALNELATIRAGLRKVANLPDWHTTAFDTDGDVHALRPEDTRTYKITDGISIKTNKAAFLDDTLGVYPQLEKVFDAILGTQSTLLIELQDEIRRVPEILQRLEDAFAAVRAGEDATEAITTNSNLLYALANRLSKFPDAGAAAIASELRSATTKGLFSEIPDILSDFNIKLGNIQNYTSYWKKLVSGGDFTRLIENVSDIRDASLTGLLDAVDGSPIDSTTTLERVMQEVNAQRAAQTADALRSTSNTIDTVIVTSEVPHIEENFDDMRRINTADHVMDAADAAQDGAPRASALDELLERIRNLGINSTWTAYVDDFMQAFGHRISVAAMGPRKAFLNLRAGGLEGFRNSLPELLKMSDFVADSGLTTALRNSLSEALVDGKLSIDDISASFFKNIDNMKGMSTTTVRRSFAAALDDLSLDKATKETLNKQVRNIIVNARYNASAIDTMSIDSLFTKKSGKNLFAEYEKLYSSKGAAAAEEFLNAQVSAGQASVKAYDKAILQMKATQDLANKMVQEGAATNIDEAIKLASKQTGLDLKSTQKLVAISHGPTVSKKTAQDAAARYVEADKAYQEALEALADAPNDNVARLAVEAAENMRNEAAQGLGKVFNDVAGNKILGSLMPGTLVDGSLKGMAKGFGKTLQTGASAFLRIAFSDILGVGPIDLAFMAFEFVSATESNKQLRGYYEDSITLQLANLNNLSIEAARSIVDAASKDTAFDSLWNQYGSTMASVGTQVAGSVIGTLAGMFVEGLATGVAVTSWSGPGAIIGGVVGGVLTGIVSAIAMGDGGLSLYNQYGGDIRKEILDATYIKNLEDAGYTYDQAKKYGIQQNKSAAALLAAAAYDSKMAYGASIFSGFGESEIVNQLDALKEFYRYKYVAIGEDILPEYSKSGVTEFNHGAQIFSEAVDYWEKQGKAEYEKLPGEDMHASLMMLMTGAQYSLIHDALGGPQNELSEMWQELLSEVGRDSDMYAMQQTVKGIDKGVALLEALSGTTIDIYNTDAATQLAITEQLTEIYKGLSREAASDLAGIQISKLAAGSYFELGNGLVFDTLVGQTDAVTAGMIRFAESLGLTVASVEDLGLTVEGVDLSNIKTIGLAAGDIEDFRKHLAGWTVALPNTFDVGTLSTNEVSILASAGITIDATGVTFAQAQLPGQAGTERDFDYDLRNVSLREQELLDAQAGISITENTFTLDKSFIDENLRSAFYELPGEVFGNISTEAATKLAGYKEIVDTQGNVISREATNEGLGVYHADTGMFEVTNAAILRGEKTIEDWLNEYDPNGTMFSDALRNDFLLPLQKIFAEGTYAEYANAVSYDTGLVDLNSLGALTLSSMDVNGASFSEYGNEGVVATVSNLSESVAEGVSKVLTKDWNALDADIKELLKDKGVKTENRGLYTTVDISSTITGSGDELLQMYSYLPDLMSDLDAATLNYLRATGRWDEENGIYTWAQQAGSSIAYVGGEFAAFTQFLPASMQTAISDAAAISQTGFEQMAAGQVLTFEAMSLEAVNSFENTSNEIALAFDDIPNQILYDFALANGYISEEMNGVTVDTIKEVEGLRDQIAGIKISKSFADTFADADTVITEQLELVRQAIASGETPLTAESAQLGVAVAQALKDGLEQELQNLSLSTEASSYVKLVGADNRMDVTLNKAETLTNPDLLPRNSQRGSWFYDSSADKASGAYNAISKTDKGWQVFYNGSEYQIQAATKEKALEQFYYYVFGEAYNAQDATQPRLHIEGYANGGILEDDGLYRLAEQGRKEAVIPLENPTVSAHIGSAMMQMMYASAEWKKLSSLVGIRDGGISTRAIERHMNVPVQEPQTSVEDMTDAILQRVLPAIVQSSNSDTGSDNKTPVYVGTLIADDNGLRELNKRMRLIEVKETRRR